MEPWKQFQTIRYFELGGDKMVFDSHFVGKLCQRTDSDYSVFQVVFGLHLDFLRIFWCVILLVLLAGIKEYKSFYSAGDLDKCLVAKFVAAPDSQNYRILDRLFLVRSNLRPLHTLGRNPSCSQTEAHILDRILQEDSTRGMEPSYGLHLASQRMDHE